MILPRNLSIANDPSASPDNTLEEWKAAREVLKDFDDRIHDLRKYGFTFVTALLAINSFLLPSSIGGDVLTDQVKLAAIGSMMLLVVALRYGERTYRLFQFAVAGRARLIERNLNFELSEEISTRFRRAYEMSHPDLVYFLFVVAVFGLGLAVVSQSLTLPLEGFAFLGGIAGESALAVSAGVIKAKPVSLAEVQNSVDEIYAGQKSPTKIPLAELQKSADEIDAGQRQSATKSSKQHHVGIWVLTNIYPYLLILTGDLVLGGGIWILHTAYGLSNPGVLILGTLSLFFILSSLAFVVITMRLSLQERTTFDFSLDRLSCKIGEAVSIVVTNFVGLKNFEGGTEMFHIESQDGTMSGKPFSFPINQSKIGFGKKRNFTAFDEWSSYIWVWNTVGVSPGIYQIIPYKHGKKGPERLLPVKKKIFITA